MVLAAGGVLLDVEPEQAEGVVGDLQRFGQVGNEDSPDEEVPVGRDVGEPGVAAGHAGGVRGR